MNTQKAPRGATPAVVLDNPKNARNVGSALRTCFNFGIDQLWFTGDRVSLDPSKQVRLPIEERFKEYSTVRLTNDPRPIDRFPRGTSVIGVDLVPGAIPLSIFDHPENAVYVFGPEDGTIGKGLRTMCHSFVYIETKSCLNLAIAVGVILSHRQFTRQQAGLVPTRSMEETLVRFQPLGMEVFEDD